MQGGLTSGMVVNSAAGQSLGEVFLVAHTDHAETGDQEYRFTMTASMGGVLGGHVSTVLTIHDTDLGGDGLANTLKGGKGDEVISAGDGNDTIIATNGDDQIRNGAGLTADADTSFYTGKGVGVDFVFNVDVIIASAFNDSIIGGSNGERYVAGAGNDTAAGSFGNDTLLGMSGEDRLTGGDLNDSVNGGAGQDLLNGGNGGDAFVFDAGLIRANVDHIADFKPVDDAIQLARSGAGPFDALTLGALHNGAFHLGTSATKASRHSLYDRATGTLAHDADGKGGVAAEVFAILDHAPRFDASDFFIV